MKRKIVDIMQDMEPEVLETFHLTEKEISELSRGINMENIQRATLEKISIPEKISAPEESARWRKRNVFRIAVAAILTICLSGTVFAIHQWYMEDFFGEGSVPVERLDRVLESQVSGGVRMTLAEVIAGEQDANVIVYFERVDGRPFPEATDVAGLEFQLSTAFEGQQALNSLTVRRLEDNHKLAYCYNMFAFESILGETLNIDAGYVFERETWRGSIQANLSKQFSAYPIRLKSEDLYRAQDVSDSRNFAEQAAAQRAAAELVTMPLEEEYPELQFAGVGFINGKLAIATYIEAGGSGENAMEAKVSYNIRNTVHITELKDRRTGEVYRTEGGSEDGGPNQKLNFAVSYFEGLTEEDLPYLTPVAEYYLPKVISDGSWSFTYTFEKKEAWKSADTDFAIDTEAGQLRITRVSASTLGIAVQGEWLKKNEHEGGRGWLKDEIPVKAVMKDGSEKQLGYIRGQTHWKGIYYKALYGEVLKGTKSTWEKQFLNDGTIEDVESVVIGGTTIPLLKEKE